MTRQLRFICPILSTGLIASGLFTLGLYWFGAGMFCFGIFWIAGLALGWKWIPSIGLVVGSGAAAFAIFQIPASGLQTNLLIGTSIFSNLGTPGISEMVLMLGAIFALVSWDLGEFHFRLNLASKDDDTHALEKQHLLRLLFILMGGGTLSIVVLTLHFKSSFEWTVILMIFTVWGISRLVVWLQKDF